MHEIADEHLLENILRSNDELAIHNREHFDEDGVFAINFMSAPGAGKTTLLCDTISRLAQDTRVVVVEGDMVGEIDAQRLRDRGIEAHQISTGRSCHLDAKMISRVLHQLSLNDVDLLCIENVGNLVCPAEFQLGEHRRVVLLSIAEGDDKPLKYPVIFRNCDVVIFTKSDLLQSVDFDIERARQSVLNLNPMAKIFVLSVKTGAGMEEWLKWMNDAAAQYKTERLERRDVHISAR
jgi:hydrogenase nickel incorporation protein HypB